MEDDNKYIKIERQTNKVQRTVTIVALFSFIALGLFSTYEDTNNKSTLRRIEQLEHQHQASLDSNAIQVDINELDRPLKEEIIRNVLDNNNNEVVQSEEELEKEFKKLEETVRSIKSSGVIMEADEHSLEVTKRFQKAAHALLIKRYGNPPYRVQMDIEFQDETVKDDGSNRYDTLLIEMAPIDLIPYSVFNFLEMARGYKSGGFHRNAGHVLQATVQNSIIHKPLAFQEYSPSFPHIKGTVGYCGRPSSVCWYVSILDNSQNHGPGSQQKHNPYEADANFGTVIQGMADVVPRIHKVMIRNKFLNDKKDWVLVNAMHIFITNHANTDEEFYEWESNH